MARPYPAGGVSIAESNHHAVGPLLLPLAASRHSAGLPSPRVPGAILIVSDSTTQRIWAQEWGCGGEDRPGGSRPRIRISSVFE